MVPTVSSARPVDLLRASSDQIRRAAAILAQLTDYGGVTLVARQFASRYAVLGGTGIEEDVLEKIFVPFFSTKKTGSGIGLSLCKQIMMVHKGNIHVQSKIDEGTVFTLQF